MYQVGGTGLFPSCLLRFILRASEPRCLGKLLCGQLLPRVGASQAAGRRQCLEQDPHKASAPVQPKPLPGMETGLRPLPPIPARKIAWSKIPGASRGEAVPAAGGVSAAGRGMPGGGGMSLYCCWHGGDTGAGPAGIGGCLAPAWYGLGFSRERSGWWPDKGRGHETGLGGGGGLPSSPALAETRATGSSPESPGGCWARRLCHTRHAGACTPGEHSPSQRPSSDPAPQKKPRAPRPGELRWPRASPGSSSCPLPLPGR